MTNPAAVRARALTKSYGESLVLDQVDLTVEAGTVFALLGPNGAGKTTAVRILATLTAPDSGSAVVAGHDVVTAAHLVRARISLTGQYAALDELQTGTENLVMMSRLRGLGRQQAKLRADELLARFDLVEAGDRRVGTYSGGMRRRLDLAAGLVGDPEIIFLDEPTTGLDPRSRQAMWEVVARLAETGTTVFLTTQYLDEADRLADRIAVIDAGRLVAEGSVAELTSAVAQQRLDLELTDGAGFDRLAAGLGPRALHRDRLGLTLGVATDGTAANVRALLDELDPDGTRVSRFSLHTATLDDVFFAFTGRAALSQSPTVEGEVAHV